jgi:calcineurin-like phosphoesterase family protein
MNWNDLGLKGGATLWFTADWHLGEPRMGIMQRPFPDPKIQSVVFRENYNRLVMANDLVIINGDVISQAAPDGGEYLERLSQFNGRKWLVRGNHDVKFTDSDLKPYFERVINHGDGIELDLTPDEVKAPHSVPWVQKPRPAGNDELHLYITHYPTRSRLDRFNLIGHIHAAWKYQKNMLNVGVDVHHFSPMHASDVFFYLTAITSFYDDDVWVANHQANALYNDMRGKQGSYFKDKEDD